MTENDNLTIDENELGLQALLYLICKDWEVRPDKKVIKQLNETLDLIYQNTPSEDYLNIKYNKKTHMLDVTHSDGVTSYNPFLGKRTYPKKGHSNEVIASLIH